MSRPRILCIMGSGETAPTMTSVHAQLIERMGGAAARPVLLDTPFGFQENADELVARTQEHFHRSVGFDIEVASFRSAESASELEREQALSRIQQSAYVFAGPGSPSYALSQWRNSGIPPLLTAKLRDGGCVVFASAAAVGLGSVALPVYEIYKVGVPVHWLEGLDLLGDIGIRAALIPHFNNAEGGTHDTRYCYMGERRLRQLEAMLPDDTAILGVDEHTALTLDLDAGTAAVRGRGRVVVRRDGIETSYPGGTELRLHKLREVLAGGADSPSGEPRQPSVDEPEAGDRPAPFLDILDEQRQRFERGASGADVEAMVAAVLGVETAMAEWQEETFGADERDQARELLRRLVVRLGERAAEGFADPRDRLAPFVEAILGLRSQARDQRRFDDADRLRDLLVEHGIEVHDGREGSAWELAASTR